MKKLFLLTATLAAMIIPSLASASATVYQHCGYRGYRVTLGAGSYDLAHLRARGIRNNDLSGVAVTPGWTVTVYSRPGFRGRSLVIKGNVPCLVKYGFNDKVSSLIVTAPPPPPPPPRPKHTAAVYQHCGWRGYMVKLKAKAYNIDQLRRKGVVNNDISGVWLAPGYKATLYARPNFRGRAITIYKSVPCLVKYGFNDKLSSIIISPK
ncbi:hypothetical protein KKF34_02955 [Myxococcota bacterium]|nr:hypothetical protein [Myxococcota bacterium]MBU1382603.1 hypothetical protein [Myxococcota bacterium]MBU1495820.1 hypothetical protein [Myxococcota bacterium]